MDVLQAAKNLRLCLPSRVWLEENSHLSTKQLYNQCPRGDWLIRFFYKIGVSKELLILAACDCVDIAEPSLPDDSPGNIIDLVRSYVKGEARLKDIKTAVRSVDDHKGIVVAATKAITKGVFVFHSASRVSDATVTTIHMVAHSAAISWAKPIGCDPYYGMEACCKKEQECADVIRKAISFDVAEKALYQYSLRSAIIPYSTIAYII